MVVKGIRYTGWGNGGQERRIKTKTGDKQTKKQTADHERIGPLWTTVKRGGVQQVRKKQKIARGKNNEVEGWITGKSKQTSDSCSAIHRLIFCSLCICSLVDGLKSGIERTEPSGFYGGILCGFGLYLDAQTQDSKQFNLIIKNSVFILQVVDVKLRSGLFKHTLKPHSMYIACPLLYHTLQNYKLEAATGSHGREAEHEPKIIMIITWSGVKHADMGTVSSGHQENSTYWSS